MGPLAYWFQADHQSPISIASMIQLFHPLPTHKGQFAELGAVNLQTRTSLWCGRELEHPEEIQVVSRETAHKVKINPRCLALRQQLYQLPWIIVHWIHFTLTPQFLHLKQNIGYCKLVAGNLTWANCSVGRYERNVYNNTKRNCWIIFYHNSMSIKQKTA